MRDLCDRVSTAQSHNIHKLVGFEPFAPAALFFRIVVTTVALRHTESSGGLAAMRPGQALLVVAATLAIWAMLLAAKLGLGYVLKLVATGYVAHYEARHRARTLPLRRVTLAGTTAMQQQQQQASKKDE